MTHSIPFHKQTDVSKQAGQQTFDRMPFLKHSTAEPQQEQYILQSHKQETTLAQYIARKQEEPPRITFDEWWTINGQGGIRLFETAKEAWNAALKQGKL